VNRARGESLRNHCGRAFGLPAAFISSMGQFMSGVRVTGKVKFFSDEKGFGFLKPDDGGDEVFVHRTDLSNSLHILLPDQGVSYELVDNPRKGNGKRATRVELV
jgi:CspA family cold shock protein